MNDLPPGERTRQTLAPQRAAQRAEGVPEHRTRIDRLERLAMLLRENEAALCESLQADFGQRSLSNAAMTEIAYPISAIRYAQKHLRAWMKDEPRKVALLPRLLVSSVMFGVVMRAWVGPTRAKLRRRRTF